MSIWLYQQSESAQQASAYLVSGNRLKPLGGQGDLTAEGLRISVHPSENPIIIEAVIPPLLADNYEGISWHISGLEGNLELSLVWTTNLQPGKAQQRGLSAEELKRGYLKLEGEPAWRGRILQLALLLKGNLEGSVLLKSLAIHKASPSLLNSLSHLAQDWIGKEPWSAHSINFHSGSSPDHWLTPVSAMAIWISISAGLLVLGWRFSFPINLTSGLTFLFLAAWFMLDFRWQWEISSRLGETYERHTRLTERDYLRAMPDGKLFMMSNVIREALPSEPSRLFILSEDPNDYPSGRLRYHLLPHRVYGSDHLPEKNQVMVGDHLLLFSNLKKIYYDNNNRKLVGASNSLAVEPLLEIKGLSVLFRITGEIR